MDESPPSVNKGADVFELKWQKDRHDRPLEVEAGLNGVGLKKGMDCRHLSISEWVFDLVEYSAKCSYRFPLSACAALY